jgi:hypothetical protein
MLGSKISRIGYYIIELFCKLFLWKGFYTTSSTLASLTIEGHLIIDTR